MACRQRAVALLRRTFFAFLVVLPCAALLAWVVRAQSVNPSKVDTERREPPPVPVVLAQSQLLADTVRLEVLGSGLVGSLELIDAQRTALANQRALLQARADVAAATVLAYEAMGLIDAPPAGGADRRLG